MPDFDTSELSSLANDFLAASAKIIPALVPVANKAGVNMKRRMASAASGHRHLPGLARAAGYDVEVAATSVSVEVGFHKQGQGNLANIAAFGSSNNAPVMDITEPLTAEVPAFIRYAVKAASEAI